MLSWSVGDVRELLFAGRPTSRNLHEIWADRQPVSAADAGANLAAMELASAATNRQIAWLQQDAGLAAAFSNWALAREEFLLVCDVAAEAIDYWRQRPCADSQALPLVRMNRAAALVRLGATVPARAELGRLLQDAPLLSKPFQANSWSLLGEVALEESLYSGTRCGRLLLIEEGLQFFERALLSEPEQLHALSMAATLSRAVGTPGSDRWRQSQEYAQAIMELAGNLPPARIQSVDVLRAKAAALAVLGRPDAAFATYASVSQLPDASTSVLAETRHRAQFLAEAIGEGRGFFRAAFPALRMIVFSGQLPDLPGCAGPFPPELVPVLRDSIRAKLQEANVTVAMCGAAAGADLLFLEALFERGGNAHIVLPWSRKEFLQTGVKRYESPADPVRWERLFNHALSAASTVRELGQLYQPSNEASRQYMREVMAGMAMHTAKQMRLDVVPMVLGDGWEIAHAGGGPGQFAGLWRGQLRQEPMVISLPRAGERVSPPSVALVAPRSEQPTVRQEVKTMLFADIAGYSKFTEHAIPVFIDTFLRRLSLLAAESKHPPRCLNTWGDAVFAVFDFAMDAGNFALEVVQLVEDGKDEWLQKGLYWEEAGDQDVPAKHPLAIRIGLHTGPVFMHYDPVVRRLDFTGTHVSRAARIEPITQLNQVFASEEFVALTELHTAIVGLSEGGVRNGLNCEYAGTMPLAKGYAGQYRIYRVMARPAFGIEDLAQAAHECYREEAMARGENENTNSALKPWAELAEDLRDANRAQVEDIPAKLKHLGYELAASSGIPPRDLSITAVQAEKLALREHDRWMKERLLQGWTYAPRRDNARRHHPLLVPWNQLSELDRDKDRAVIRNLPAMIERAGFRLKKLASADMPADASSPL